MTKNNRMSNEPVELKFQCPLCMEPMDFDDVDFYPCPCRYQICRFCWDKIINEENGLCPACRKPYNSEHPASYKPRTEEEIKNKIKHSKKICIKKTKPQPEGKEYLSEYRVLQKNLIFVVGLPMRMADEVELLKGLEYFGKCGKVYKIVINQNQTFPGPQGTPCLSAYVTYHRNEDALKTLVDLKKLEIDGRAVKLSLGTTKYCSQFLRNRRCTKQDCMYLHEMGDQAASFTKDDMSNGKHTEYENQLIQEYFESQKCVNGPNSLEQEKLTQRKSSLPSASTSEVSCASTPSLTLANTTTTSTTIIKCQRTALTPIGTDPNDASKIYSVSSDNCHSKNVVNRSGPEQCKDNLSPVSDSVDIIHMQCDLSTGSPSPSELPFNHGDSNCTTGNNSLLDSFYYLNSQVINHSNGGHSYDQQQVNNSALSNYDQISYKSDMDFPVRSFGSDRANNTEPKFKDTADIDFDPINISRLGLAELIATENRQKLSPYLPQMYATSPSAPALPAQRTMLRSTGHEYLISPGHEFYCTNSNTNNLSHRVSNQSFLHDKLSSSIGNSSNTLSVSAAPTSSGFPSPPPGFEMGHSNGCIGESVPNDHIMSMILAGHSSSTTNNNLHNTTNNVNNMDLYNGYQSQHPGTDNPMALPHQNNHYSNQYSIPNVHSYHNEFPGFSNGGSMLSYNDINCQSSQPWKNVQSVFCDGVPPTQDIHRSSAGYGRSHSMNENTGIRSTEWNGFNSYNSTANDSHLNSFHDGNSFLISMRGQSVGGVPAIITTAPTMTTGHNNNNDCQIYVPHRQQLQQQQQSSSHSVNH